MKNQNTLITIHDNDQVVAEMEDEDDFSDDHEEDHITDEEPDSSMDRAAAVIQDSVEANDGIGIGK